ncbi:MAG: FHA domain-containing protein [Myxococcales bacterium]
MPVGPSSWAPKDFVERARRKPLGELVQDCGTNFVLVVPLGEPDSELAQGLSSTIRPSERAGIGFKTLTGDAASLMQAALKRPTRGFMAAHSWDVPGAYVPIPRHLLESACHVMPIVKRSGASFLERISVGRVNGHDVVLRHASVSKFHAWFEAPEDGNLYVGDAGSRNYTYVNGERITDRTRVQPGAKLTFGMLEAHVYTLESFWKALHPGA